MFESVNPNRWLTFASVWLVLLGARLAAAKTPKTPVTEAALTELPTATLDLLRESGGILTPSVRASYIEWAKNQVLGQMDSAKIAAAQETLHEIESDPTLKDAVFASVLPPDKTILENYIELRSKLGANFERKYRSLVVAAAVAHREGGLSKRNLVVEVTPDPEDLEIGAPPPEPDLPTKAEVPDEMAQAIVEFMNSTNSSAIAIYEQPAKQQQLSDFLKSRNIGEKAIARLQDPKTLGKALKAAMVALGQRPAKRQPAPDIATWLQYLGTVYESSPKLPKVADHDPMRWPLFPMDKAPWPMLMPLTRPMPLDEARYIYEKFEGQHGPDRYHTYGPYRKFDAQLRAELQPSTWHWGAWPDRIIHGGVCVVMSGIAIDTRRALCQPSTPAAQPHHSNLISFNYADGKWSAHVDQAFAGGPPETHSMWMFNDVADGSIRSVKKGDAGAEYHLGLGAAMNVGLGSYMDTRIAIHLFRALPDSEKPTIGVKLLTQAMQGNPFNPALWYRLAEQTTNAQEGQALVHAILSHAPDASLARIGKDEKHRKKKEHETALEISEREYWETVAKFVIRYAVDDRQNPPADKKVAQSSASK